MSESLRNDGRIWVPKKKKMLKLSCRKEKATDLKEEERDYYLERRYPAFGNLVSPRRSIARCKKNVAMPVLVLVTQV